MRFAESGRFMMYSVSSQALLHCDVCPAHDEGPTTSAYTKQSRSHCDHKQEDAYVALS